MIGTVWNNGSHNSTGSGYGIKISRLDRDRMINKEWKTVQLMLEGEQSFIEVNIDKKSFWRNCREMISKDIGLWLIKNNKNRWQKNKPYKLKLNYLDQNKFEVEFL